MKKSKIVSMVLTIVILVTSCNLGMMFTSNADTTIEISTADELANLDTRVSAASGIVAIEIKEDIDASGIKYTSVDASNKVIYFNGNNHLIKNLNVSGGGLFTAVDAGSSFSDVGMYNCTITDFDAGVGYGFLAGIMTSGTVKSCFVDGNISVYGNSASFIGGLVGSFGGTMENCYSMVDIYTNGSYVGGLIGNFVESETVTNSVTKCYSTGSIDNDGRDHIGGLIGSSAIPCITDSYTSMCILNPYADTVKSIGVITGLSADDNVYYDKNVSLQRQGDMDPHRCTPAELSSKLNGDGWICLSGYYPQLTTFSNNSDIPESFIRISALSAAIVDVSREDGITTGREFTVVSTADKYSYAILTTVDGSSTAVLPEVNQIDWRITGGVDEYYFDPTDLSNFPTNSGSTVDGLSGNTYDVNTGKYLFVNTGDIKFTAYSGKYERDIYVHVTTADKNPYIQGGVGTEASPFIINNYNEFDMIRVYCLDDETGKYYYSLAFSTGYIEDDLVPLFDLAGQNYLPVIGMKGTLNGNGVVIRNLNVTKFNEGNAGLFATVTKKAVIKGIHISNAVINATVTGINNNVILAENSGLLAGSVENAKIEQVIATGTIENSVNSGLIAGAAYGDTELNTSNTFGVVSGVETSAGMFGTTEENVKAVHCYSSAVITDAKTVGGFFAVGGGDVEDSVFTGNLSSAKGGVRNPLVDSGEVENAYFDWQAAGILYSTLDYAVTTEELISPDAASSLNLDMEYWGWFCPGEADYEGYDYADRYPQLKHFSDVGTSESTYTSRTSNISAFTVLYDNTNGEASSISFTTALADSYYEPGTFDHYITEFIPYGDDTEGYGFEMVGVDEDIFEISVLDGGKQIYFLDRKQYYGPCDVRYVMFNVKNINVHYKFAYDDSTAKESYNADMVNKGLTTITNGSNEYNLFLDSTLTDNFEKITFVYAGDNLSFKMTQGRKYTYIIDVYSDAGCTNKLDPIDSSEEGTYISLGDYDDVYVVFTIRPDTLPWGIYRLKSN